MNAEIFAFKHKYACGINVSQGQEVMMSKEELSKSVHEDLSQTLAQTIDQTGKLYLTKQRQPNGDLYFNSEVFVFTQRELDELIRLARYT